MYTYSMKKVIKVLRRLAYSSLIIIPAILLSGCSEDLYGKIAQHERPTLEAPTITASVNKNYYRSGDMPTITITSGAGATIVYFGLPGADDKIEVPALQTIQSDKTIKFAWLAPLVWPTAIAAVGNGLVKLDKLVTHRFSLEDAEKGIQFMKVGKGDKLKGLVVI